MVMTHMNKATTHDRTMDNFHSSLFTAAFGLAFPFPPSSESSAIALMYFKCGG